MSDFDQTTNEDSYSSIPSDDIDKGGISVTPSKENARQETAELVKRLAEVMEQADQIPSINTLGGTNAVPRTPSSPPSSKEGEKEKNEGLLIDIDCIKDLDSDEYLLVVKAGIRIGNREVLLKEKKELSESLMKKIEVLRGKLDEMLKNKVTLIKLLK